MSLSQEILKHVKENSSLNPATVVNRLEDNISSLSILDEPIGQITSRDQIINPFELVDPSKYRQTRRGQAAYNSDLERAKLYAQQQEAAYKEWFESPEQVYARERQAGRNPDLTDVMNQDSASVAMPEGSPIDNIPTTGEVLVNSLSGISNVFSAVSGIMNTISGIGLVQSQKELVNAQADGQFLNNMYTFGINVSNAISDSLASAMQNEDFDMDKFFAGDFDSIYTAYLPSDDPRYRDTFNRVLNHSKKVHSDAYAALGESEDRRKHYLANLSSGYYSADDDEMTGQLSIVVRADEELHRITTQLSKDIADIKSQYIHNIDAAAAADAVNAQNEYTDDYYSAMNGEIVAKINQAIQVYDATVKKAGADVYQYLNSKFNHPLLKFLPSFRSRVGFEILAGAHMGWQDHLYSSGYSEFMRVLENIDASTFNFISQANAATKNAAANERNAETNARRVWTDFAVGIANAASHPVSAYVGRPQ